MKNYNIGLDIGTSSVGWAVVEADTQKIIKKGKNALWGVRLFSEGKTAEERRKQRSVRRRYNRRRYRIKLLREMFKDEMNKVDPLFFNKLNDSFYSPKDKINKYIKYTNEDKQFIKNTAEILGGQTIYHIRKNLLNNEEKADIRHIYLALHHMVKYRGHFNAGTGEFNANELDLSNKLAILFEYVIDVCPNILHTDIQPNEIDYKSLETALLNPSKNDLKVEVNNILKLYFDSKFISEFNKAILGNKFNIFMMLHEEDAEKTGTIALSSSDLDEKILEIEKTSEIAVDIIELLKDIKDTKYIKELFKNEKSSYISDLMVKKYSTHKKDLKQIKDILNINKGNGNTKLYNKYFRNPKNLNDIKNACLYTKYLHGKIGIDELCNELLKDIKTLDIDLLEDKNSKLIKRIENEDILPKINSTDNSAFPYQLNEIEMNKIIENQGKYYPFLLEKYDEKTYKIVRILKFKIPYYVGPLTSSKKSEFAWMIRNSDEKISPFNFESVINKEQTAEEFISRMLKDCTYLFNEKCLPNNSILYCEFKVLNELKQISISDKKLDNDTIQKIYNELFLKKSNITDKVFKDYLKSNNITPMYTGSEQIKGYSGAKGFANNMSSYIDFFGENGFLIDTDYDNNIDVAETIITYSTIFEDREIFEAKLKKEFPLLSESVIKKIVAKKYNGWGNLSKKLITYKYYPKNEYIENQLSIMDLMRTTNQNFMQILNNKIYGFEEFINEHNTGMTQTINHDLIYSLATSPANKKGIWQAIQIVRAIIKKMGNDPKYISIEMARSEDKIKKRKDSKRDYLLKLYKNIEDLTPKLSELYKDLKKEDPFVDKNNSQIERLYLYYIQGGKCMYSGEELDLSKIMDSTEYDVDHILPQALIKDNSFDNKVLVIGKYNKDKKDSLVVPYSIRKRMEGEWEYLRKVKLMSEKKYKRLTRKEYSDNDIEGFINRQLVETRQICKHVANILENHYKDTEVIYLHADLSSTYRKAKELYKFRNLNNFHHVHDAYLAAVLGEYTKKHLKHKVTKEDFKNLISEIDEYNTDYGFVVNSLNELIRPILNEKIYQDDKYEVNGFNEKVAKTLMRNDILVTKKTEINTGTFYKVSVLKKGQANSKLKDNLDTNIYGGYTNINCAYMMLIKYGNNKKKLIGIPCEIIAKINNNFESPLLDKFIREHLKLKESDIYKILLKRVPFNTIIEIDKHPMYITGYGIANQNNEIVNSVEFKLNASDYLKYKYILRELNKSNQIEIIDKSNIFFIDTLELIKELYKRKTKYPSYKNTINVIENTIKLDEINSTIESFKIINELLKIYSADSKNGNLKEYGLGDRMGRKSATITTGTLIFKSILGDKETRINIDEL